MKTFLTTVICLCAMASSVNAKVVEKKFDVKDFKQVELFGASKVIYQQGDSCSVTLRADESKIADCEAYSDGQTLSVRYKGNVTINVGFFDLLRAINHSTDEGEIVFYVTSPDLTSVSLSGSGDFISKNKVDTDELTVTLRGSGDIDFSDIICDRLYGYVIGSGDLDINRVESLTSKFELKGSGDIDVAQYKVKQTELSVLGSGDIKVICHDCEVVNATICGSGDITLSGDIKRLNKSIRGSGDIHY